jgi:hypothetical protein
MAWEEGGDTAPRLVPAAACDYTTGYLAAFGALVALLRRAQAGGSYQVRVSLARTGMWYMAQPRVSDDLSLPAEIPGREAVAAFTRESATDYGQMTHLAPVVQLSKTPAYWELPTPRPGSSPLRWVS